ncbi:hypothetical protein [Nostoc sp. MG11]|uniref:hypothetical protein n=1 Tax=Nostoc sp. MG11 TaxID=2721166 RepID=UPI0029FF2127|nr:hypothetical protein [Nostoc sp. MG11]
MQATFQVDVKGSKIRLYDGHTTNTGFYAILKTYNSWTAEGLRKANANTLLYDGLSFAMSLELKF